MSEYDVVVLGAGPGGYTAAATAARNGLKTLLVEKDHSGGTCLNRGCIPTKALLYCAERYDEACHGKAFGVECSVAPFDYAAAAAHRDRTVKRLRAGVDYVVKQSGATFRRGEAVLFDANTICLDGERIGFSNLILATGSIPAPVPFEIFPGANVLNSDGFLAMNDIPPRCVVVVGGGVIGLEIATILSKIGRAVTVIEASGQILPPFDASLATLVRRRLEASGVTFFTEAFVRSAIPDGDATRVTFERAQTSHTATCDFVVTATGRVGNSASLRLERAGLTPNKLGFLETDDRCATLCPHIYGVGDINGHTLLAHAASWQGERVAENIAHGTASSVLSALIPSCVYTDPEIATIGLTPDAARQLGREVKVGRVEGVANGKMLTMGYRDGFVQLVADPQTGELLGCQMATPRATDQIAEIGLLMRTGGRVDDLIQTVHPHPTLCEMVADAAHMIFATPVRSSGEL